MAIGAGCRNVSGRVIRIRSGIIIGQMTYGAIFGKTAKGAVCMTPGAIEGMTKGQWEKRVVHIGGIPGDTVYRMTLNAVF